MFSLRPSATLATGLSGGVIAWLVLEAVPWRVSYPVAGVLSAVAFVAGALVAHRRWPDGDA
jgi:MFS family permease